MPDDAKVTEQETEETPTEEVDETEVAFSEDLEDEDKEPAPKGEEKPPQTEKKRGPGRSRKEKPEEKKQEKEEPGETGEETEEESEEEEPSTQERLDKRLESIKDDEDEEEPEKKEEPESKPEEKKGEEAPPSKLTKELISERLKLIAAEDLPGEIIIGDETVNLKQYAEDYPDDYAAIRVLSSVTAEKMIEKAFEGISFPKTEDVDKKIGELDLKVAQLSFDNAILRATDNEGNAKHPDALNIIYGEGMQDFHRWVKEQSPKIQKLATSLDPEDGVLILDYYKEDIAKKKTDEHDKSTKAKKKQYDDIYASEKSVKTNQRETGAGDKSPDEEAEEAFKEEE